MLQPHATGTSRIDRELDIISDNEDSPSPHPSNNLDERQNSTYGQLLKTAIISILVFWVLVALAAGIYNPGSRHLPPIM